jgi:2Fe-2S ferredoxin
MAEMKIRVTDRAGHVEEIECEGGILLMQVLAERDLVEASCGGACSCATCQIYVDEGSLDRLPQQSGIEQELLEDAAHVTARSRLACQITLNDELDGMAIEIAKPA